jgi:phage shock protein A
MLNKLELFASAQKTLQTQKAQLEGDVEKLTASEAHLRLKIDHYELEKQVLIGEVGKLQHQQANNESNSQIENSKRVRQLQAMYSDFCNLRNDLDTFKTFAADLYD